MKIAYFDCFSGASGDMLLGALVDAGLALEDLQTVLAGLHLTNYRISAEQVFKRGLGGTQVHIEIDGSHHHHHRHLKDIETIIRDGELPEAVQRKSLDVFQRLARAEAAVHRIAINAVHFHEVGAVDAILDIVGTVAGLHLLRIEKVICSPLNLGSGTVTCAHGVLPVPAPATAELVKYFPVYAGSLSRGRSGELLTPTGAALLTTLAADFGPLPSMQLTHTGYGAGRSDFEIPNLLRVMIGQAENAATAADTEQVAVLETNIDDMNPQIYAYLMDKVLAQGAMDMYLTPVYMKKNRPGMLLTLVCSPEQADFFSTLLLRETTTIGIRRRTENRVKAQRQIESCQTPYGPIGFKIARLGTAIVNIAPEYEDCRRAAETHNVPLKQVMAEAHRVARNLRPAGLKETDARAAPTNTSGESRPA